MNTQELVSSYEVEWLSTINGQTRRLEFTKLRRAEAFAEHQWNVFGTSATVYEITKNEAGEITGRETLCEFEV